MKINIKHLIGYILLVIISIATLGLCFYGFFDCGYSIVGSILFTLLTYAIAAGCIGVAYFLTWLFD